MTPIPKEIENQLVVVDVETSGTSLAEHSMVAAAFVPLREDRPVLEVMLAHDGIQWSPRALAMFRSYEPRWREHAVEPKLACEAVVDYVQGNFGGSVTIVAHNVAFDFAFLRKTFHEARVRETDAFSHRAIDTHTLLFLAFLKGKLPHTALSSTGAFAFFGIDVAPSERHTALGDAKATRTLLRHLLEIV